MKSSTLHPFVLEADALTARLPLEAACHELADALRLHAPDLVDDLIYEEDLFEAAEILDWLGEGVADDAVCGGLVLDLFEIWRPLHDVEVVRRLDAITRVP